MNFDSLMSKLESNLKKAEKVKGHYDSRAGVIHKKLLDVARFVGKEVQEAIAAGFKDEEDKKEGGGRASKVRGGVPSGQKTRRAGSRGGKKA